MAPTLTPRKCATPPNGQARTPVGGAAAKTPAKTPVGGGRDKQSTTRKSNDHRYFDAASEVLRPAMNDLPYDHYQTLAADRKTTPMYQESRFTIDDRYAITVKPMGAQEDGRIRLDVSVELCNRIRDGRPLKALNTRLMAAPGKAIKLRGFDHYPGELVIVLVSGG